MYNPTGAAILAACVTNTPPNALSSSKIGYGIGYKDFAVPNVLRVALGDYDLKQEHQPH